MNKKLKISIYSGSIPSTTFIENLIKSIALKHKVILFGKSKTNVNYSVKNIYCYQTYSNKVLNLIATKWRMFLLLIAHPKRFQIGLQEIKLKKGWYSKYNWWTRYAPVLLHLPDVFHLQWAKDVEYWMFLKEKLGVKLVLSLRGAHINYSPISNPKLSELYNCNFPKIDAFHAVSVAIGLEAQKYEADPKRIKVIHSLIPETTFNMFKEPKKQGDILKIISVGRHHWIKGYSTAIEACNQLKIKGVNFSYTIIANGVIPEELIYQQHQLNLLNEVKFKKGLSQDKLFKKIQEADVLLLPSLKEGIANVVLEAMALGVPVISTGCGGMEEVIINCETGWLVPVLDAESMANSLIQFKKLATQTKQIIAKNAFEFVHKEFDSKKGTSEFVGLYEALIKK